MKYNVVVDFEMCTVKGNNVKHMKGMKTEIIQIGAVLLNEKNHIVDEFVSYVKPVYGKLDEFIINLTGITEDNLINAPILETAIIKFIKWLENKKVTMISWSNSDYIQLKEEMKVKNIKATKIDYLLDGWVDFQDSFKKMLGLKSICGLKEAMSIGRVKPIGRLHDGFCDAYNTARLYAKIHRQQVFELNTNPIELEIERNKHLNYRLGDLFTKELLSQIEFKEEEGYGEDDEPKKAKKVIKTKVLCVYKKVYCVPTGKKSITQAEWNKHLFKLEMRKIEVIDMIRKMVKSALL